MWAFLLYLFLFLTSSPTLLHKTLVYHPIIDIALFNRFYVLGIYDYLTLLHKYFYFYCLFSQLPIICYYCVIVLTISYAICQALLKGCRL